MTKHLFAFLAASLVAAVACAKLNTSEQKTGYSIGLRIGTDLARIKDKVEVAQIEKGIKEELEGKSAMDQAAMQAVLSTLQSEGGDKAKAGYAVGVSIGKNLKPIAALVDLAALSKGLKDQLAGKKPALSEEQQKAAMEELGKKQQEQRVKDGEANKISGQAFLEGNKKKAGINITSSGLQYIAIKKGSGKKPRATSTVSVHYTGTLADGTKFDSSVDRGQPAEFPLNGVIKGWTEGLQLMPEGSTFRFFIPSDLAYGESGQGPIIGPNMPLIFDVELLKIVKY